MNWRNVNLILTREVRDQMRDRRTLFMIFVLPLLLYPLLGMSMFQITQFIHEQATDILVLGFHEPADFPTLLRSDSDGTIHFADELFDEAEKVRLLRPKLQERQESDAGGFEFAKQTVKDGAYAAVVYFPSDFEAKLQAFRDVLQAADPQGRGSEDSVAAARAKASTAVVPSPELFYNTADEKSQLAYVRLKEVLDRWSDAVGRKNLASRNLPESTAKPFQLAHHDVAAKEERHAAMWSKILPFLLMIWALTGAFYPAIDLCAGEKERGTLETLLSSPAERIEIVTGKLLTVMLFSVVTAVLNLLSMGLTGSMVMRHLPDFGPPPPLAPIWLFIALLPMAAVFSALCIALASFARSTKEGQYYLMPVMLVTLPLVILPMAPSIELSMGVCIIPVTGVVVLLRAMLEGRYWEALPFVLPVVAVTGACCLLSVRWAVDQFNSENVLFRDVERGGLTLWVRHLLRDRGDTPNAAAAALCGVLVLTIYFFMSLSLAAPTTFGEFMRSAIVTQLVVILLPTLLMTAVCARSPKQTLRLVRPTTLGSIPAAILLALALHPSVLVLNELLQQLYPLRPELLKLGKLLQGGPVWVLVLVLSVVPAVFEELAFRGFVLSGFRHVGHKWRAIALASLLFGLSHGAAVQQAISAALMGLVLGYLCVQTGSIFTGMAFHVTHNAAALLIPGWVDDFVTNNRSWAWAVRTSNTGEFRSYHVLIVLSGIVAAGAVLRHFAQLKPKLSEEEELTAAIEERSLGATA